MKMINHGKKWKFILYKTQQRHIYYNLNYKLGLVGFRIPVGFKPGNPTISGLQTRSTRVCSFEPDRVREPDGFKPGNPTILGLQTRPTARKPEPDQPYYKQWKWKSEV
jgi:hypothetical protein